MAMLPFNPYRKQLALAALATGLVLWSMLMIVSPDFVKDAGLRNSYLPFFILLFLSLFWSMWAVTGRWKRSGLWSIIITAGMWLRSNQLDTLWNVILLLCFGVVWEYYWHISKPNSIN